MGKKRRALSIAVAVVATVGLLAGCGSSQSTKKVSASKTTSQSASKTPVQLVMDEPIFGSVPKDWDQVESSVSKITMQKIGCTVKVNLIDMGAYAQQFNLVISGGQPVDVMYCGTMPVNMFTGPANQGEFKPLGKLLDQYGQGIKQALAPPFLRCGQVNGVQYAIPCVESWATENGFTMRKDLVEKYHINLSKIKSPQDMTAVFATIKAHEPTMYPLAANQMGTVLQQLMWYDPLGDSIGVLPNWNNNLKVVNVFSTPKFAQYCNLVHSWYVKGYIQTDAATSHTNSAELIKTGRAFSMPWGPAPGEAVMDKASTGYDVVFAGFPPPTITTFDVARDMYVIPTSSKHPQKAMQFLNLLYTNKAIVRLLQQGIEGKDYVKSSGGVITYPPGLPQDQEYQVGSIGNNYLDLVYAPNPSDLHQQWANFTKEALQSKALGFQFNSASVKTQYAAVENVMKQYYPGLVNGVVNPVTTIPKFVAALKAAGIDKIIAAKQEQLTQWAKRYNVKG